MTIILLTCYRSTLRSGATVCRALLHFVWEGSHYAVHGCNLFEDVTLFKEFNAEVRRTSPDEADSAVGHFGNAVGTARGDWFHQFAWKERLVLANTCFEAWWENTWTHVQNGRPRQIDYICIDQKCRSSLVSAGTCLDVGMGADHRAVQATIGLKGMNCRVHQGGAVGEHDRWTTTRPCRTRNLRI